MLKFQETSFILDALNLMNTENSYVLSLTDVFHLTFLVSSIKANSPLSWR
jgi:hypothetical protein